MPGSRTDGKDGPVNADDDAQHAVPSRSTPPDTHLTPPNQRGGQRPRSARWRPQDRSDLAGLASARAWARRMLPDLLEHPMGDELAHDVELLLAELCSNAVRHGDGLHEVHLHCDPPTVRVTVSDRNTAQPVPHEHGTTSSAPSDHGRGLILVQAIASRWGVDHHGERGKAVWCELPIHRPPPPAT